MKTIRIGSRESRLAVIQSEIVMGAIRRYCPQIRLELVTMKTTGDRIQDRTLDKIGGKGLFVKELDEALLSGRVDLCVHSYKDMPILDHPQLPVVAVSPREDARDVLLLPRGSGSNPAAPIGCSSQRRRLQYQALHSGRDVQPVRGNVLTRIEKLDSGQYGGLILAAAGIKRLDLWDRVDRVFTPEEILPSACQGILAVQGRAGENFEYLKCFHDSDAWDASVAERAFIRTLDGGCTSPAAAYATVSGDRMTLTGMYVNSRSQMYRGQVAGCRHQAEQLGIQLASELKEEGRAQ